MTDWDSLSKWEDQEKAVAYLVITVDDVREWSRSNDTDNRVQDLDDEVIYDGLQHVCRKFDTGDYWNLIVDWALDEACSWNESKKDNSDG